MSTRAKWALCLLAFIVGGLIASIPAFLGSSPPKPKPVASYQWFDRLPVREQSGLITDDTLIARAPGGGRLLAGSLGGEELCLTLGQQGGGGCMFVDRTKQIQLAARDTRKPETLWGILADDVRAVRISYADGSHRVERVRRAFGATGHLQSIAALDAEGNELGSVRGDANVPMGCGPTSCFTTVSAKD